jgi:hypothetical protein
MRKPGKQENNPSVENIFLIHIRPELIVGKDYDIKCRMGRDAEEE